MKHCFMNISHLFLTSVVFTNSNYKEKPKHHQTNFFLRNEIGLFQILFFFLDFFLKKKKKIEEILHHKTNDSNKLPL